MEYQRAVIYARYSSNNQRDESIDAQVRAAEEYATRQGLEIINKYADRAKSATTDKRPEFLKMISDSNDKKFDIVLVHKLDRFSRDRYDSSFYKRKLKANGIKVVSITEQLDDSPESVILESVLEGMAEYYSKNLARETMKGLTENALQCKHTGGKPPLGYDVDKETRRYIINVEEAKAVKLIFDMYLGGYSAISIIKELNTLGYKSKKNKDFGSNSIRSILKNEKYSGVYIFNKSSSKDAYGKRNGNKDKSDKDIIRIEGGIPAIVTLEQFKDATTQMKSRIRVGKSDGGKEVNLLAGIIKCGKCGSSMYGNRRKAGKKPAYTSYRCGRRHKHGSAVCNNKEIRKEYVEEFVFTELERFFVNDNTASSISDSVNEYLDRTVDLANEKVKVAERKIKILEEQIDNILKAIMDGYVQEEFKAKLEELKRDKYNLENDIKMLQSASKKPESNLELIKENLSKLKWFIQTRNIPECRKLIKEFVKEVRVYNDCIEVYLHAVSFIVKSGKSDLVIKTSRKDLYVKHSKSFYETFLRERGYKYSREVSNYGNEL